MDKPKIVITQGGPYCVCGNLPLGKRIAKAGKEGDPEKWVKGKQYPLQEEYALCRCGQSEDKPFCDGSHVCACFDGTETASFDSFEKQAETVEGPGLDLKDSESLCAGARFCHPKGGVWDLVAASGDPDAKDAAMIEIHNCPSGRLVAYEKKTGKPIESDCTPSISLIEDPQVKASGPIWVHGCVPIETEDGRRYETRNRVTLCRCGQSKNKPFCDATHIDIGFNDGDDSLCAQGT